MKYKCCKHKHKKVVVPMTPTKARITEAEAKKSVSLWTKNKI